MLFQLAVVGVDLRKRAGLNHGAEVVADGGKREQDGYLVNELAGCRSVDDALSAG